MLKFTKELLNAVLDTEGHYTIYSCYYESCSTVNGGGLSTNITVTKVCFSNDTLYIVEKRQEDIDTVWSTAAVYIKNGELIDKENFLGLESIPEDASKKEEFQEYLNEQRQLLEFLKQKSLSE